MERLARRRLEVEAATSDPYDGIVRLVTDAERFGFGLAQISMTTGPDSAAMIRMTLEVEPSIDCAVVTQRFSRHPVLAWLSVAEIPRDQGQSSAAPRASMLTGEWMRP